MIVIFPPYFRETEKPFVNTPCIVGDLKKNGCSVNGMDVNVRFFHYFTQAHGLEILKKNADQLFLNMESAEQPLNEMDAHLYTAIARVACTPLDILVEQTKIAVEIMHDERYYDPGQYSKASALIQDIVHTTVVISEYSTHTRIPQNSITSVKAILDKTEGNLYRIFFEEEIIPQILALADTNISFVMDFNSQFIPTVLLAKILKEKNPDLCIYVGGDVCSHLHEVCRRMPEIFLFFEGIITHNCSVVLSDICRGIPKEKLNNLICLKNEGIEEQNIQSCTDQKPFGMPDYSYESLDSYFSPEPELTVYTGCGCYWAKCAFCSIYNRSLSYKEKEIQDVMQEIQSLQKKYNVRQIAFGDEEIRADRLLMLAKEIIRQHINIKWSAQTRFDMELKSEEYDILFQSGCVYLGFGLESGDNAMLKRMRTGFHAENAERILKKAHDSGIMTNVSLVIGFPGETVEQWNATVDFLLANRQNIGSILPLCYSFTKNSAVDMERDAFGICAVYDEQKDDSLLLHYPNYVMTAPDWQERERRINSLNENDVLFELLLREKFPRGLYAVHGEVPSSKRMYTYILLRLQHDIIEMRHSEQYHFSGDQCADDRHLFAAGEKWFLFEPVCNQWVAVSKNDAIILNHEAAGGTIEDLTDKLNCTRERTVLMRMICLKKYHNIQITTGRNK